MHPMTPEGHALRSLILSIVIHGGALVVIAAALRAHGPLPARSRGTWVNAELVSEALRSMPDSGRRFEPTSAAPPGAARDPAPAASRASERDAYASLLRARVDAAIAEASGDGDALEGEVVLELEIDAEGRVVSESAQPSDPGLALLVRAAARAASPFPPPRPEWLDERTGRLKVRLPVRFE